ncbi:MAG: SDR family NAD(P)-dependent oxidoreductase [Paracoccaceae bacterium]|jgi:NAD(P)-dependent dehydrogenase (short-subunit alcohol dehydrogenase family)|nr:MAG: SDR family NAD(P)-dependent oxidoreductase [Alphaproteobacteria bacterium]|tara:strand:+ start:27 stop:710 length:684 start_codon:yes stop_codon:yes gene_type:complete
MYEYNGRALIFGASGGIGLAFSKFLENKLGIENVIKLSRSFNGFEISDEEKILKFSESIEGSFNLIINAIGVLQTTEIGPEKTINAVKQKSMIDMMTINAIGPALLLKNFSKKLDKTKFSVFVNLSARVGSITDNRLGGWISYRSSKAALNQIIKTSSIEINRRNKNAICVGLHPGTVKTRFTEKFQNTTETISPEESVEMMMKVIESLSVDDNGYCFAYDGKVIPS